MPSTVSTRLLLGKDLAGRERFGGKGKIWREAEILGTSVGRVTGGHRSPPSPIAIEHHGGNTESSSGGPTRLPCKRSRRRLHDFNFDVIPSGGAPSRRAAIVHVSALVAKSS